MATLPYFVFSPNTLLSVIGLMRGPDRTPPTPAEDWRDATVDVIIPALNEQEHVVLCLASLLRQTLRPRRIVLVDDGSSDATTAYATEFCACVGVELVVIQRSESIGKTPTIRQHARELDSDVLFVLDADTVLESENYIERTVEELYQAGGIASAFGAVLPLRPRDRRAAQEDSAVRAFAEAFPSRRLATSKGWLRRLASGTTNLYREVLYLFLQRFVYRGQMTLFGTTSNPVGCAVAYRREYLEALFDSHRAAAWRRSDDLRGHLHRAGDAQRGISECSGRRCVRAHSRARSAAPASPTLSLVVRLSAVQFLLRHVAEESIQVTSTDAAFPRRAEQPSSNERRASDHCLRAHRASAGRSLGARRI